MKRYSHEVTTYIVNRDFIHQTITSGFCTGSERNKVSLCQVEIASVSASVCKVGGFKSIYFVWKAQMACCWAEEQAGGSRLINYYWKANNHHLRCRIVPSAFSRSLILFFLVTSIFFSEILWCLRRTKFTLKTKMTKRFLNKDFKPSWNIKMRLDFYGMSSNWMIGKANVSPFHK